MARTKKKVAEPTVVQSAMQVTVVLTLPITDGSEVNDVNEYVDGINQGNNDVTDIFNSFYASKSKAKAKLITITSAIPAVVKDSVTEA